MRHAFACTAQAQFLRVTFQGTRGTPKLLETPRSYHEGTTKLPRSYHEATTKLLETSRSYHEATTKLLETPQAVHTHRGGRQIACAALQHSLCRFPLSSLSSHPLTLTEGRRQRAWPLPESQNHTTISTPAPALGVKAFGFCGVRRDEGCCGREGKGDVCTQCGCVKRLNAEVQEGGPHSTVSSLVCPLRGGLLCTLRR